ncbi:MAG: RnfABCDGE type electron transport complex subunit D [Treponemataceae bacterium]|nr:RnfABCDGE type electron transport complex subunit D [Treponemataceae bacterium]
MAAPSDKNEIYLSSSPHFKGKMTTTKIMLCVIISLLPICINGIVVFGLPALVTILVSTASCVLFEFLFQLAAKQPIKIKDCSAIVTGLLLACVLPPSVPVWMTILGAAFAIIVAKAFFGGIGSNVFNPALAGRAFMFVSFPVAMGSRWLDPALKTNWLDSSADAISSATALSQIKAGDFVASPSDYVDFFMGNRAGCIGETSILWIIVAFIFLMIMRIIDGKATIAMVATVAICSAIAGENVGFMLISGGLLFGAVFMVTDYATTPVTGWGRVIFGAGCGLITFLIRKFGAYPEGVMFSILIMNSLTAFLNKIYGKKYGFVKKPRAKKSKKEASK